jgi:hypothetical protein
LQRLQYLIVGGFLLHKSLHRGQHLLQEVAEAIHKRFVAGQVIVTGNIKHGVDRFMRPDLLPVAALGRGQNVDAV